jgi:hypothetical protein
MDDEVVGQASALAVPSVRWVPVTTDRTRYSKRGGGNGAESAL